MPFAVCFDALGPSVLEANTGGETWDSHNLTYQCGKINQDKLQNQITHTQIASTEVFSILQNLDAFLMT